MTLVVSQRPSIGRLIGPLSASAGGVAEFGTMEPLYVSYRQAATGSIAIRQNTAEDTSIAVSWWVASGICSGFITASSLCVSEFCNAPLAVAQRSNRRPLKFNSRILVVAYRTSSGSLRLKNPGIFHCYGNVWVSVFPNLPVPYNIFSTNCLLIAT
jgi:hypothetical protein